MRKLLLSIIVIHPVLALDFNPVFKEVSSGDVILPESNLQSDTTVLKVKKFEMMKTEVTQSQWLKFMPNNSAYFSRKKYCPSSFRYKGLNRLCPDFPMENVNFHQVEDFIGKLNKSSKKYYYSLPSIAEYHLAYWGAVKSKNYKRELKVKMDKFHNDLSQLVHQRRTRAVNSDIQSNRKFSYLIGNVWEWSRDKLVYERPMYKFPYMRDSVLKIKNKKAPVNAAFFGGHFGSEYMIKESIVESDRLAWASNMLGFRLIRRRR